MRDLTEKHPGGRPRKFKTVAAMQKAIDAYFHECDARSIEVVTRKGDVVTVKNPAPYTVTGIARVLGLSRQGLLEYQDREEFSDTIKRAKERVHENLEFRLYDGSGYGPGHIFGLKNNYGWKDKTEHEHSGPGGGPIQTFDIASLPKEERDELLKELWGE